MSPRPGSSPPARRWRWRVASAFRARRRSRCSTPRPGRNNSTENKLALFVLSERFISGFTLGLMRKDLAAALGLGNDLLLDLPLAPSLMAIWERAESG